MNLHLFIVFLLIITHLSVSISTDPNINYQICSTPFPCGNISNITYPFYDGSTRPAYCGYPGFKLDCSGAPQITISNQTYFVKDIEMYNNVVTVYREDSWLQSCPDKLNNNSVIDFTKFHYTQPYQNISLFYDCGVQSDNLSVQLLNTSCSSFYNSGSKGSQSVAQFEDDGVGYYLTKAMLEKYKYLDLPVICSSVLFIPISEVAANEIDRSPSLLNLTWAFKDDIRLGWTAENEACSKCTFSGGECGYSLISNKFVCYCSHANFPLQCQVNHSDLGQDLDPGQDRHQDIAGYDKMILTTAILAATGCGMLVFLKFLFECILRKCNPEENQNVEDCLKNYASIVPKRYSYTNIKKITKSFKSKLGEGGYGTVFKGCLQDGRVVAVKVWKQTKGDGQEFVNEVMSISRTSHINIVPLLGFCFEGCKRALIYEFMPNGSLEKFLHVREIDGNNQSLSTHQLLDIAIGIASGLEYLHRGCSTRIVHFDIKPHNILLDAEFVPKISDFGLAKPCKQKESIIFMSEARGTIGYIAPEVFYRSFGGVSHKSDVYSFGMMLLEMAGCTKRANEKVENSSQVYFPQWIYKQLEEESALESEMILDEENELRRKMILVGLWCIQTNPLDRPPMSSVVDMLKGKIELLHVPPMPSFFAPQGLPRPSENGSIPVLSSSIQART